MIRPGSDKNRGDNKERLRMLLVKSLKVSRVLVSCGGGGCGDL